MEDWHTVIFQKLGDGTWGHSAHPSFSAAFMEAAKLLELGYRVEAIERDGKIVMNSVQIIFRASQM